MSVFATDIVWTGAGDGKSWSDRANWSPEPQSGQPVVFNSDVVVEVDDVWRTDAGAAFYPCGFKVTAGKTCLVNTTNKSTFYVVTTNPYADVSAGAEFCVSTKLDYYQFGWFDKRGDGKMTMMGGYALTGEHVWQIDVEAGTLEADGTSSTIVTSNLIVRAGATLSAINGGRIVRGDMALTLEEGATLYLNNTEAVYPAALQGEGDVVAGPDGGLMQISNKINPAQPFTGTFGEGLRLRFDGPAAGCQKFILQRADQLAGGVQLERATGLTFRRGLKEIFLGKVTYPGGSASHILTMADEDGNPLAVHASLKSPGYTNLAGGGDLYIENPVEDSVTLYQNVCTLTGRIVCTNGCELIVGSASSSAHNFDLTGTGISGITYRGRDLSFGYYNPDTLPEANIPIDVVVTNKLVFNRGGVKFGRNTRITTKNLNTSSMGSSTPFVVAGGELYVSNSVVGGISGELNEHRVMCVAGGVMSAPRARVAKDPVRTLPKPGFLNFSGASGWMSFSVTGGWFGWNVGTGLKNVFARGGRVALNTSAGLSTTAGALADGGRAQLVFDGGTVVMDARNSLNLDHDFQGNDKTLVNYVTEKGGWLVTDYNTKEDLSTLNFHIPNAFETCTNCTTDGGINLYGAGSYDFTQALAINGPLRVLDGVLNLRATQLADPDKPPYGTGDLVLGNTWFRTSADNDFKTKRTMTVRGALEFGGSVSLLTRWNGNYAYADVEVGSLRTSGKGSVLQLRGDGAAVVGTDYTFKVKEAPETDPNTGALRLPVLICDATGLKVEHFATYDAEKGIVPIPQEDYAVDDLTQGANKFVSIGTSQELTADRAIAGARYTASGKAITVPSDWTLTVGNGRDPAFIIFNNTGALNGSGTIDFRGSEGHFRPNNTVGTGPHVIAPTIAGSNGVAYTGSTTFDYDNKFRIDRAATYTGGTYINGCRVWPNCAGAFSTGDVYVGAGERAGGEVDFHTTDTFANNFHIGGWGFSRLMRYGSYTNVVSGALTFEKGATIAGDVELTHPVCDNRIAVRDRVTGTILGTVSGARLVMYNTDGCYGGTLAMLGHNTYTGGTEIVRTTLAVREADGFGTGKVTVDMGALVFQNKSDITIANDLEGVGTLRMTGGGAVSFSGSTRDADFTLDLDGAAVKIAELPAFVTSLVNADGERASLTIPAGASVDLSTAVVGDMSQVDVIVGAGATLTLGGDLTVRRLTNAGTVTGGTVTELHPRIGFLLLVK